MQMGLTDSDERVSASSSSSSKVKTLRQRIYDSRYLYLLVIPSMFFVVAFSYVPAVSALYHSFTIWSGRTARYVGLDNFRFLVRDPYLNKSWIQSGPCELVIAYLPNIDIPRANQLDSPIQ